jgi:hypothetical protein
VIHGQGHPVACISADTEKLIAVLAVQNPVKAMVVVHVDTAPITVYGPLLMSSVIVLGASETVIEKIGPERK